MPSYSAYRNLHKPGFFSIRYQGKVVEHASTMVMEMCHFFVSEKSRLKTVKERRKRVHAWVRAESYRSIDTLPEPSLLEEVWYSPYFVQQFIGVKSGKYYTQAKEVYFANNKCFVMYDEK